MKKFLKYTLIIFAFVLVISVKDRVSAIANSGTCTYQNVEFSFSKLSNGYLHCEAMKLLNGNTKIIYPDTIDNVPVVSIGGVISDSKNIRNVVTSVELPSELTSIANNAFYRCTNLKTVKIKDKVQSIGDSAFRGCKNLTNVTIPNSVISIGEYAFSSCTSLTSITIPSSVRSIGASAFFNCRGVNKLNINTNNLSNIAMDSFSCLGNLNEVVIPKGVQTLSSGAFSNCNTLGKVTLPNGLKEIGSLSLDGLITEINIPVSVQKIDSPINSPSALLFRRINAPTLGENAEFPSDTKIYVRKEAEGYDKNGWEKYSKQIIKYEEKLVKDSYVITSVLQLNKIELANSLKSVASISECTIKDPSILSLDSSMYIQPKKNGTTNIDVKIKFFDGTTRNLSATVNVNIKASRITLDKTDYTFSNTNKMKLNASIYPTSASKDVTWKSTNESIATVDENGNVTPVGNGTCKITASTTDESNLTASCNISVNIKAEKISLDRTEYVFITSNSMKLTSSITPSLAKQNITWKSNNEKIATVDENGNVTPKGYGRCRIRATTTDGSNLTAECIVDVRVPANRISLDKKSVTITSISQKEKVEATIEPIYSFPKAVYKSSNTNIAKVDSNGNITPVGNGTCRITATTLDGTNLATSCDVIVDIKTGYIILDKTNYTFNKVGSMKLNATVSPKESNNNLKWSSSDEKVAKVNSDGTVTAVGNGTCKITVETTDGTNLSVSCNITVDIKSEKLSLDKTSYTFNEPRALELTATVLPKEASKDLKWTSSDEKVAKVTTGGVVVPVGKGSCKITVETTDGTNLSASCSITSNTTYIRGDITRDGKVDMEDVYTAMKRLARGTLSDEDKLIIEVTNDGRVDMEDIYKMLKYIAGKITVL